MPVHHTILAVLCIVVAAHSCGCSELKKSAAGKTSDRSAVSSGSKTEQPLPAHNVAVQPASALTFENFKKINDNTTRDDIIAIFGQPRNNPVTGADVARIIHGDPSWGIAYATDVELPKSHKFLEALTYSNSTTVLVVAVIKNGSINPGVPNLQGKVQTALMFMRKGSPQTGTFEFGEARRGLEGRLRYKHDSKPLRPVKPRR